MPEKTDHAPGEPCWAELTTPDVDATERFYDALFGWSIPATEQSEQFSGYRQALKGEQAGRRRDAADAGGASPRPGRPTSRSTTPTRSPAWSPRRAERRSPSRWTSATWAGWRSSPTRRAPSSGSGRPARSRAPPLVGEHGAPTWSELGTRDVEAARAFYAKVLDWRFEDKEFDLGAYTTISAGGGPFGGLLDITERVPAEIPAHWLVYFARRRRRRDHRHGEGGRRRDPGRPV